MRESDRRIKEYKKILPHLKEKVLATAFLFAMSIVMMTAATFAWITLSQNPEIKGIATNVVANGNLEIALSDKDGLEPDASQVGDSKKELVLKNLTWGNIINVSHESYGLEHLVLRPATLNRASLDKNPLFAAEYSADGRVEDLTSAFEYSMYDTNTKQFVVTKNYGVRAISSVSYTYAGSTQAFYERKQAAESALARAKDLYTKLVDAKENKEKMDAVCGVVGLYLTDSLNDYSDTHSNYSKYVPGMYELMVGLNDVYKAVGEAYVHVVNMEVFLSGGTSYYTFDTMMADDSLNVTGLSKFKSDYNTFQNCLAEMAVYNEAVTKNNATVHWADIDEIVGFLVDIPSATVDGYRVSSIGMSLALDIIKSSEHTAIITKGALVNMEKMIDAHMYAEDMSVTASYSGMSIDIENVTVCTNATSPYYLPTAIEEAASSDAEAPIATAADTYGMAIDFWVRSNANNDFLILEGNVLTKEVQKTDENGGLYYTDPTNDKTIIKYGDTYYDENGDVYTVAEGTTLEVVNETVVTGYEGENRIWDDADISEYSSTQGSGSCYVFYSDTPQQQAQSLELMASMGVAFVDEEGNLLAEANFDVDNYYAESGRVTVPMKLKSTSLVAGKDDSGNSIYAITLLEDKQPKRITAIIYVEGSSVENTAALADADIEGTLNIQFGSMAQKDPIVDEDLYYQTIEISGSVTPDSFDYAVDPNLKSTVTLNISGIEPDTVKASFIRQINSTQGTKQKEITFTPAGDGTFTAEMNFPAPGDYVLRTVWVDGVEYKLSEPLEVNISGFAISTIDWRYDSNYAKAMSAENYQEEAITLQFAGTSIQPNAVQGVFSNQNNQNVTIKFNRGSSNWVGTGKFTTSGMYTLQYLIIDGEYYEIPASLQKTLDLSLGMKANVQISQTVFEEYDGTPETLQVYVTVTDDKGTKLTGLQNISIQYLLQGSTLTENGMYSTLTWDATEEKYLGNFRLTSAGAYEFGYLTIGASSINSATAPVITAIPPVPPSYYSNLTKESIFAFGSEVYMKVALQDSIAVADNNAIAILEKLDASGNVEATVAVPGTKQTHIFKADENASLSVNDWMFSIPSTSDIKNVYGYENVSQVGKWQMKELQIIGAYNNGVISTVENPFIIDVSGANIVTTINDELKVIVSGEGQENLTSPKFLDPAKVTEGLTVQVRGADNEVANGVEAVTVTYKLDTSNVTYSSGKTSAGYSTSNEGDLVAYGTVTVNLVPDPNDATSFIIDYDTGMSLPLAGTYKLDRVTFKIGNNTYATTVKNSEIGTMEEVPLVSTAPNYIFEWDAPVVTIKDIKPVGEVVVNKGSGGSPSKGTATNVLTNEYTCTVHLVADITVTTTTSCGETTTETTLNGYSSSTVTTELDNVNKISEASLFIDGTDSDVTFTYSSSSLTSKQEIGKYEKIVLWWDRYLLGSNKKGTHITISGAHEDATIAYTFKLDNAITINNPY